jgi:hypothetical protein
MSTEGNIADGKRMKIRADALTEYWTKQLAIGSVVVHKTSGFSAPVFKLLSWGVEIWSPFRLGEREIWSWEMIVKRQPRSIKRYPRPWRFPRTAPTNQCHCKGGPMILERRERHAVRCQNKKCKKLIGSEAFPARYRRAEALLRAAVVKAESKKAVTARVARPQPKTSRGIPDKGKAPQGGVDVGHARTAKKAASRALPRKSNRKGAKISRAKTQPTKAVSKNKPKANKSKARTGRALPIPKDRIGHTLAGEALGYLIPAPASMHIPIEEEITTTDAPPEIVVQPDDPQLDSAPPDIDEAPTVEETIKQTDEPSEVETELPVEEP